MLDYFYSNACMVHYKRITDKTLAPSRLHCKNQHGDGDDHHEPGRLQKLRGGRRGNTAGLPTLAILLCLLQY